MVRRRQKTCQSRQLTQSEEVIFKARKRLPRRLSNLDVWLLKRQWKARVCIYWQRQRGSLPIWSRIKTKHVSLDKKLNRYMDKLLTSWGAIQGRCAVSPEP